MSRESEKALKELNEFLEQYADDNMSDGDMENLVQKFIGQYNDISHEVTEETAKTSEDFYDLACDAKTKAQALKYARRALQLDAENIDAKVMVEELSTEHPYEILKKYPELIEYGKEIMAKKGYMDEESMGNYWGIIQTRPFIRMYSSYMDLLMDCGMMRRASEVGEEIIRYNKNDNLGVRFTLMHIYAFLEDEASMLELHKKYDEHEETQMLLPLSVVYYKLGKLDKAEEYLRNLEKINKDTSRFMRAVLNDTLDKYLSQMNPVGYRPFSIEELIVELNEQSYMFQNTGSYFDWAVQVLKKKKAK